MGLRTWGTRAAVALAIAAAALGVLGAARPAPHAVAAPACDVAAVARQALDDLGEHVAHLEVISPDRMAVEVGDRTTGGYADPDQVTLNSTLPCRFVATATAHEVAHVWQYRATGTSDGGALYDRLGHDPAEVLADCTALLTGWETYSPYLAARQKATGQVGCTGRELAAAAELRGWAR